MGEGSPVFIPLENLGHINKEDHPDSVEEGYVVPRPDSVNSERIAGILETWIKEAPAGSITLRSKNWILDQWGKQRGVMILGHPKDGEHLDIFGDQKLDEATLKQHIVSVAFINELDAIPIENEVELGTVLTNPHYQSNGKRRGVGGGVKAFQAIQDHAHKLFPQARLFSWVKNGSLLAIESAFDELTRWSYDIDDSAKALVVFASCDRCPDSPGIGKCCHAGYEIKNEALGLTFEQ